MVHLATTKIAAFTAGPVRPSPTGAGHFITAIPSVPLTTGTFRQEPMRSRLEKRIAVRLFGCLRQAERSVHYALSNRSLWGEFTRYYDTSRRAVIESLLDHLRGLNISGFAVLSREYFSRDDFLNPLTLVLNRLRRRKASWRFSNSELAFIYSALVAFEKVLDYNEPPAQESLIRLRMELLTCEWIIHHRMLGVPEIRRADHIEHFLQSPHMAERALSWASDFWSDGS